jgi:O-antigen/teichoic acid export membrane protein
MSESLRHKTTKGFTWSAVERFSSQFITFGVIVVMSRILTKSDYGLIGMLTIFIDIAQTIADSGVSQALVRKQDRSQKDCSTAFIFNMGLSLVLYAVLFFSANAIARFYNQPILTWILRLIGLSLILNAAVMVPKALLTASMDFKTLTKATFLSSVISGIAGIAMAYLGLGVWSIAYYQLIKFFLNSVLLWVYTTWRPNFGFSVESFKYFFSFGSNFTIAGVMHTIYRNLYLLVIGKFYQAASLGLYTRAYQFGQLPSDNIGNIFQRASYPVMCKLQDNKEKLKDIFTKFLRILAFVVFPLMVALSVLAEPVIVLVVGEKWRESGPLLAVLCLAMMWVPLDILNLTLLQVRGKTNYYLRCELWKKGFGIAIVAATLPFGLLIMCWGQVLRGIIDMVIDTYYTGKYLELGFFTQLKEILPTIIYSALMAATIWCVIQIVEPVWAQVILGMLVGLSVYILMAVLAHSSDLRAVKSFIKDLKSSSK